MPDPVPLRVKVVIPTYNGGAIWHECAMAVAKAVELDRSITEVLVVDSSSRDDTPDVARDSGFALHTVHPGTFDHGRTRNEACSIGDTDVDVVVFLTQDAIPETVDCFQRLVSAFADPAVAVAYGRQLPHVDANPVAAHARHFNYPEVSHVSQDSSKETMGIKAVFTSNSFAAYRLSVFKELGGFPEKVILSEDMYFAAKAVLAGHRVAYVADAMVRHSHNYRPLEEFRRYFDIGVFHHDEAWIANEFGGAGGEGKRFILSELRYLLNHAPLWIPRACVSNFCKILGYKLGKNYAKLPAAWRPWLSMHKRYWDKGSV
jgi:rhamnosyltransferase